MMKKHTCKQLLHLKIYKWILTACTNDKKVVIYCRIQRSDCLWQQGEYPPCVHLWHSLSKRSRCNLPSTNKSLHYTCQQIWIEADRGTSSPGSLYPWQISAFQRTVLLSIHGNQGLACIVSRYRKNGACVQRHVNVAGGDNKNYNGNVMKY